MTCLDVLETCLSQHDDVNDEHSGSEPDAAIVASSVWDEVPRVSRPPDLNRWGRRTRLLYSKTRLSATAGVCALLGLTVIGMLFSGGKASSQKSAGPPFAGDTATATYTTTVTITSYAATV